MLKLLWSLLMTSREHSEFKVSVYPTIDHFSKKSFFAFSDKSYCDFTFKKNFYEKRLILSSYNRKTFLYINYL